MPKSIHFGSHGGFYLLSIMFIEISHISGKSLAICITVLGYNGNKKRLTKRIDFVSLYFVLLHYKSHNDVKTKVEMKKNI